MKLKRAVLVTFSVNCRKFSSTYERNKFFKLLYGWKQVIKKERGKDEKIYVYRREGLLDEIPHQRIDQSSFIIPEDEFEKIERFMREWEKKVIWKAFKILLEEEI